MEGKTLLVESQGEAVERCLRQGFEWWRRQHFPSLTAETAWASEVLQLRLELGILKHGRLRVSVTVEARQPWKKECYYWTFAREGTSGYREVSKA